MAVPPWQRQLLATLTRLETTMAGVREELAGVREEQARTNTTLTDLRSDVAGLATRLDNALTATLGEPLRQLQTRVRRLERQVFPGDAPPES